jgi:hypothetical protein
MTEEEENNFISRKHGEFKKDAEGYPLNPFTNKRFQNW